MTLASVPRAVLFPIAGLFVWAAHFTAVYAANAHACERAMVESRLLGLPWVPALVALATAAALLAIAALLAAARPGAPAAEGGESEPHFTRWLAAATGVLSGLAVVFQAIPAFVLPPC